MPEITTPLVAEKKKLKDGLATIPKKISQLQIRSNVYTVDRIIT